MKVLEDYLTISQWLSPELLSNILIIPTEKFMSDLVHNIAYIRLLIALSYGALLLWSIFLPVFRRLGLKVSFFVEVIQGA